MNQDFLVYFDVKSLSFAKINPCEIKNSALGKISAGN